MAKNQNPTVPSTPLPEGKSAAARAWQQLARELGHERACISHAYVANVPALTVPPRSNG